MNIAVVGTGYVGLVTGTCLAETGNNVICVDINEDKISKLRRGEVPIYEPMLEVLFHRNIKAGRLKFTTHLKEAVEPSTLIFLALPTPPGEDGSADLSYILGVAGDLGKIITSYKIIVGKSTVPVGTAEKVRNEIRKNYKGEFDVVSNPEFLREGFAVEDFMKPDRVVIGSSSEKAIRVMKELYGPFVRQGNPVFVMDERSSELTKYAANSFLAMKISFMNELANLCEKVGANVDAVRIGIGSDNRIGKRFLFPGIGYGGSCFPKDVQALIRMAHQADYDFKILDAVEQVNHEQKKILVSKISDFYKTNLKGKRFGIWGLAFKPDTDDIREAPALEIIRDLLLQGATVSAFDPQAMPNVKEKFGDQMVYAEDMYSAIKDTDALIICTEWAEFRTPDLEKMGTLLKEKTIFDGRNLYEPITLKEAGFKYFSMGR